MSWRMIIKKRENYVLLSMREEEYLMGYSSEWSEKWEKIYLSTPCFFIRTNQYKNIKAYWLTPKKVKKILKNRGKGFLFKSYFKMQLSSGFFNCLSI